MESLTPAEIWKIQDDIKYRKVTFNKGDRVMLFYKRTDGYPRYLKIGDFGSIIDVELNHIIVNFSATYGPFFANMQTTNAVKLPKKYFVEKIYLRELKLKQLLG